MGWSEMATLSTCGKRMTDSSAGKKQGISARSAVIAERMRRRRIMQQLPGL
jgi:hypothetical protein